MANSNSYQVMAPRPFTRRSGPWPREELAAKERKSRFRQTSQEMENQLEKVGLFQWYRDYCGNPDDPRKKMKGKPHAFGLVELQLSKQERAKLLKRFPELIVVPKKFVRLTDAGNIAVSIGQSGSLQQADLWHKADVGLSPNVSRDGRGVRIAVVDSGIDLDHAEFAGKLIRSVDIDYKSGEILGSQALDTSGHGTHVASLIGGKNVGIAPGAKLVNVRVFPNGLATPKAIIAALNWIVSFATDVNIVNLSAMFDSDRCFEPVIQQLLELNMLFVCSSGNELVSGSPADYDAVLTVGASTRQRKVWAKSGSKLIQATPQISVPDLIAPGVRVWGAQANGAYVEQTGTSQSAAIVSGLAALEIQLRSGNGRVMADQVIASLRDRTESIPSEPVRAGRGIVHL